MPRAGSLPAITIRQWDGLHCPQATGFPTKDIGRGTAVEMSPAVEVQGPHETVLRRNAGEICGARLIMLTPSLKGHGIIVDPVNLASGTVGNSFCVSLRPKLVPFR